MCQDCIKFLTDAQAEAKANSSYVDSLIENIENQCDLLGPSMSSLVCVHTLDRLTCELLVMQFADVSLLLPPCSARSMSASTAAKWWTSSCPW